MISVKKNINNLGFEYLFAIIILGVILRLFISFYVLHFDMPIGAKVDAFQYHQNAQEYANFNHNELIGGDRIYEYFLGTYYLILSDNILIGNLISIICWLISIVFLNLALIENKLNINIILISNICYIFMPSSIIFSSVTLREPFQMMLISSFLYFCVVYLKNSKFTNFFLILANSILLYYLHIALFLSTLSFTLILLTLHIYKKYEKLTFSIFFLFITFFLYLFISQYFALAMGELLVFRKNALTSANTYYSFEFNFPDNIFNLIFNFIKIFFFYLFKPFPWDINNLFDLVVLLENSFRLSVVLGLYLLFFNYKRLTFNLLHITLITILLISVEFIWALGTSNWGTSIRHHTSALPILIYLNTIIFSNFFSYNRF